jgi:CheY-like chemotaxis protein
MADEPHPATPAPGILVVDDDQIVLGLLKTVLVREGFQVWASPSGHDALDVYGRNRDGIDLVLLDVCMPGLDGPGTLAELRRVNPAVRCCFMSGNTGPYSPEDLLGLGSLHFFEKPFQLVPLVERLGQLARGGVRRSA